MTVLRERWVMSLALVDPQDPAPGSTPLFFALVEPDSVGRHAAPLLVFASSPRSRHGQLCVDALAPVAAGASVYLESETVGELRGAQLRGTVHRAARCTPAVTEALRARYLARHPVAAPVLDGGRHELYVFEPRWAKVTDNRLGFGVHPTAQFSAPWSGAPLSSAP